jgi:hypothetical protein
LEAVQGFPSRLENVFGYFIECKRCGAFEIDNHSAADIQNGRQKENIHLLQALTRHMTENKQRPMIIDLNLTDSKMLFNERVIAVAPRADDIEAKSEEFLKYIANKSECPGYSITFSPELDYPIGYCRDAAEAGFYISHLRNMGLIETKVPPHMSLTADGWKRVFSLNTLNTESSQGFVAMSFAKAFDGIFSDGIEPAEALTGYKMLRMDGRQFNGKICDEIILEIRRSRFVVAEVSGQNRGVYYEAGYAMGLGIPVIWCCKESAVARCHFDTRQFNHILWKTPADLQKSLSNRILATIGSPAKKK